MMGLLRIFLPHNHQRNILSSCEHSFLQNRNLTIYRKKKSKLVKTLKWGIVIGAVIEMTSIGVAYYFYRQMTRSTDFRYKIYKYDARLVDAYYRMNERYGDGKKRDEDYKTWGISEIPSFSMIGSFGL